MTDFEYVNGHASYTRWQIYTVFCQKNIYVFFYSVDVWCQLLQLPQHHFYMPTNIQSKNISVKVLPSYFKT